MGWTILIQAYVLNKDIGFVRAKLPAAIKVDTFDFQKYGMVDGVVKLVSHDSRDDDKLGQVTDVIEPKKLSLLVDVKSSA